MKLLTIDEAAREARVCRKTLERQIENGNGPTIIRIGRRKFIDETDNARWLESLRQPAHQVSVPTNGAPA